MQPTLIGFIQVGVGLYLLLNRRVEAMLAFVMACTLMGGSAAIIVTALGKATISPGHLALGFLMIRLVIHRQTESTIMPAMRGNLELLVFALYGIVGAVLLPRIFRNDIDVVPMKPTGITTLFDLLPLEPTSQNVTTAVYMVGSTLLAICAFIAVRQPRGATQFVKTATVVTMTHAVIGIIGVAFAGTWVAALLGLFRNGTYAQLDQSAGGYLRIAGIMPEASSYAIYGFAWLVLMTELWLRDIMPRRTGIAAALMALVLIGSTSSTAYVALGSYAAMLILRMMLVPQAFTFRKVGWILGYGLVLIVAACLVLVLNPELANALLSLGRRMTVQKSDSFSGRQRLQWAWQGFTAFQMSFGLGIGPGSFRSSSIVTAIIGSVGIIGTGAYVIYLFKVFRPFDSATYRKPTDPLEGVGVALSWAALISIIPACVSWPSSDPGLLFALMAGAALGLRTLPTRKPWVPRKPIRRITAPLLLTREA